MDNKFVDSKCEYLRNKYLKNLNLNDDISMLEAKQINSIIEDFRRDTLGKSESAVMEIFTLCENIIQSISRDAAYQRLEEDLYNNIDSLNSGFKLTL